MEVQPEIPTVVVVEPAVSIEIESTESPLDKFVDNALSVFAEILEHGFVELQKEKFLVKCMLG